MILSAPPLLQTAPQKIISLVPSQTELLYDLGLESRILGITKFCVHPKSWETQKIIIGGTKNLRMQRIEELKPDLIIANKEENNKADIEALAQHFKVWVTDVPHVNAAMQMIADLGVLTHTQEKANALLEDIHRSLKKLEQAALNFPLKKIVYLIWQEPLMTIGSDSFIHDMLQKAGFENLFADRKRYPEISVEEIRDRNPDYLFLSTEPYPFGEKHKKQFEADFPNTSIFIVDGEMCSWYGSRMQKAFEYLYSFRQRLLEDSGAA